MIYFVAATELNRVKIGFASDPWKRLSKIQSDSPCKLTMLAFTDGKQSHEAALHERFAADRLHGEWFTFSDAIRDHVESLEAAVKPRRESPVTDIARKCGVSKGLVSVALSDKGCSPKTALLIEKATDGAISASDLSPVIAQARKLAA